ncbi:MAG: hypothetical protein DIU74_012105 [Pseudomonadota bacterium]
MAKHVRVVGMLGLAALLAACAGEPARPGAQDPETVTRAINLSGYPPEFRQGFKDGCVAARSGRGAKPQVSDQYGAGWRDGYDYCAPKPR